MKSTTPKFRIARPEAGTLANWQAARSIAKSRNVSNGRGHRAVKAQDGNYSVVFRPAVAANKQRRTRDLSGSVR